MQFAFVFPGQGSQTIGMLSNMAVHYPVVEETFYEASKVLGYDLWSLVQYGSTENLNKTWQTQPALLTASVALWRIWQQRVGKTPKLMAGHSLGEYSALVCAGVIDFSDALLLVETRGKFMQEAVPEGTGAMAAIIGLNEIFIKKFCKESAKGQIVSPANFNSPNQIVISGHKETVERTCIICKAAGAKYVILPVSIPSHCILMKPAAKKMEIELNKVKFNTPLIPVVNNVNAKCEVSSDAIRDALIRQLYSPVQWTKTIEFMSKYGINHLYEIGPGRILTNLTKHITNNITASALNKPEAILMEFTQ